jgi:flagellar protein FlbD
MIELTRLNGRPMVVNSDLIKTAEASPDTMLTLINGEKLIVREEIAEVVERIQCCIARGCWRWWPAAAPLRGSGARCAALASLDVAGQPGTPRKNRSWTAIRRAVETAMATVMFSELHMDKASIGGAVLAIAGIIAGLLIEGGNLGQILQPTAALIVFGGTWARCCCSFR